MSTIQYAQTAKQQCQQWYTNPTFHKRKKLVEVAKLAGVRYLIFVQLKRTQYLQQCITTSTVINVNYNMHDQSSKSKNRNFDYNVSK